MATMSNEVVDVSKLPDIPPSHMRTLTVEAETLGKQKKIGRVRQFEIMCDEPAFLGGDDEHPQPLNYLLAGVAF